jgi:hypothetical protein
VNASPEGYEREGYDRASVVMEVGARIVEALAIQSPHARVYDWFMSLDTGHKGHLSVKQLRRGIVELDSRIHPRAISAFIDAVTGEAGQSRHVYFGE